MTKNLDLFTVKVTDTIHAAMLKITANHRGAVIILDGARVVGVASDGDIRRAMLRDVLPISPVEKIMNINCRTTTERDPTTLAEMIRRERITVLPIVNEQNELVDVALV
jgi:CBS domain-containing protein